MLSWVAASLETGMAINFLKYLNELEMLTRVDISINKFDT
jgi:hypothetical protein